MKKIFIFKIGGSVLTNKSKSKMIIRKKLLSSITKTIKSFLDKNKDIQLVIVHGAGQPGHSLAKKYKLSSGGYNNKDRLYGALLCNIAIKKLHEQFMNICLDAKLNVFTVDPASIISQKNGKICNFDINQIEKILSCGYIPVLYGHIVFDNEEILSICSGDTMASYLAESLSANKLLFASDVNGIYTKDPFKYSDASLLPRLSINDILLDSKARLSCSHNKDVTDGLRGKIKSFVSVLEKQCVKEIVIFNGLKKEHYSCALSGKDFLSTKIFLGSL